MSNFFYTDANGTKRGPITDQQLKALASQGVIQPTTMLNAESGWTGTAKQIPGLTFGEPVRSVPVPQPTPSRTTQAVPTPQSAPKQLYCTNCGNAISEQAVACMSCGAKPIGHKKFCRQCGVAINPEQVVCVKCGAGVSTAGIFPASMSQIFSGNSTSPKAKTFENYFMAYWITLAVAMFFGVFAVVPIVGWIAFFIIDIPAMIACVVIRLMMLYQCWRMIPANIARTTPGKAVGFLFIPIFNFYWMFVAYMGLCDDLNKTLQQRGIQFQIDKNMGMIYCILWLTVIIPFVNILTVGIGVPIISIVLLKFYKDAAIALLEQEG